MFFWRYVNTFLFVINSSDHYSVTAVLCKYIITIIFVCIHTMCDWCCCGARVFRRCWTREKVRSTSEVCCRHTSCSLRWLCGRSFSSEVRWRISRHVARHGVTRRTISSGHCFFAEVAATTVSIMFRPVLQLGQSCALMSVVKERGVIRGTVLLWSRNCSSSRHWFFLRTSVKLRCNVSHLLRRCTTRSSVRKRDAAAGRLRRSQVHATGDPYTVAVTFQCTWCCWIRLTSRTAMLEV